MSTNSVLTPCKQGAVLSRYSLGLGNEYKLRTHTLRARCGTFLTSATRPQVTCGPTVRVYRTYINYNGPLEPIGQGDNAGDIAVSRGIVFQDAEVRLEAY